MSAIFLPRRWRHQPQGAVELDRRHPLADGLAVFYLPSSGLFASDPGIGWGSTFGTINRGVPSTEGVSDEYRAGSADVVNSWVAGTTRYAGTLACSVTPLASAAGNRRYVFSGRESTAGERAYILRLVGDQIGFGVGGTVDVSMPSRPSFPNHRQSTAGLSWGGSSVTGHFQGETLYTHPSAMGSTLTRCVVNGLAGGGSPQDYGNHILLHWAAVWNRPLSGDEHRILHESPYALFRAPSHRIWFDLGAGPIGVEINAKTGAAVAAGHSAGIATAINASAGEATAGGLTAQVVSATAIDASLGAALASGLPSGIVDAVVVSAHAGAATAAGNSTDIIEAAAIAAQTGRATAAGRRADIGAGNAITASSGTAAAAGLRAGVSSPVTVTAGVGAATASGIAATIITGADIHAATGSATAAGLRADVAAGNAIAAGVGAAAARGLRAELPIGADIAAGTAAARALGLTAEVVAGQIVVAGVGAARAAGLRADVATGNAIGASAGSATARGLPGEIESGAGIDAAVGVATAAGLPASLSLLALHGARSARFRGAQLPAARRPIQRG